MNSRQKGSAGERQWRDELRAAGFSARRGQQFCGNNGDPDVACPALPNLHWEVKRVERLNITDAMAQAVADARAGKMPVVAHRRNHGEWLVTMRAADWFHLIKDTSSFIVPLKTTYDY